MSQAAAPKDYSVLVIDDDPSLMGVIAAYLEEEGYRVGSARSGEAGLAAFDREPYDIVITDLKMPGISGLEVVRRVKEKRPETEVIVITGYATVQTGVEATRDGAYDFLLKPLKVQQLDAVLDRCTQWIEHRRSHAELQEVNRKLYELNRMKDRFLAVTDHELRTPVTVLDGMLQLILKQVEDLPERLRDRLETIAQVSRRLVHLIRDVHDIVQSRKDAFTLDLDWTTVETLTEGVGLDFEMTRFNRSLHLVLDCRVPEDFRFQADAHRLRHAVTELVQNAVKATPDGGRVEVRLQRVEHADGPRLCVGVSDTGVGIPPEERDKIFETFYGMGDALRHHTSKYEFRGSGIGIGLPLALEIAKAHGGGIDFESAPGSGSSFTLWIPCP
ncbi:MAG: hybrid sensor histidine kinase/response regulator [Deferrisomatales bacterium]